ncbi:hypothetical protein AAHC03_01377 [Spirometra sp. Aus1]
MNEWKAPVTAAVVREVRYKSGRLRAAVVTMINAAAPRAAVLAVPETQKRLQSGLYRYQSPERRNIRPKIDREGELHQLSLYLQRRTVSPLPPKIA